MTAEQQYQSMLKKSLELAAAEDGRLLRRARIRDAHLLYQGVQPTVSSFVGVPVDVAELEEAARASREEVVSPEVWLKQACRRFGVPYRQPGGVVEVGAIHAEQQTVRPVNLGDVVTAFGQAINASLAGLVSRGLRLLTSAPTLATASDGQTAVPDPNAVTLSVTFGGEALVLRATYLREFSVTEFAIPHELRAALEGAYLELPLMAAETRKPVVDEAGQIVRLRAGPANGGYINVPDLPDGQRAIDVIQNLAASLKEGGQTIELVVSRS